MTLTDAIILAVIQGVTEFLPVSSSGHLVIAQAVLGTRDPLAITLLLHLASLLAIAVWYRRRLVELFATRRREMGYLVVATLPIVAVGAALGDHIEKLHAMPLVVSALLVVNGFFLFISDRCGRGREDLSGTAWWKPLVVGAAQAVLLPGLSRSGRTIGTGWLVGWSRPEAVVFSFLMFIPAMLGALVWKSRKLLDGGVDLPLVPSIVGFVLTFALSLASIRIVETLAVGRRWLFFSAYSVLAGLGFGAYFLLR